MSNRIDAYLKIKPSLSGKRQKVYNAIHGNDYQEIARITGLPEKTVSGRISELESYGMIMPISTRNGLSIWEKTPDSLIQHFKERWIDRRIKEIEGTLDKYKHIKEALSKIKQLQIN